MADAARGALRQMGCLQVVGPGKLQVLEELQSLCELQELGQPAYSVCFGSSVPDKVQLSLFLKDSVCIVAGERCKCKMATMGPGAFTRLNAATKLMVLPSVIRPMVIPNFQWWSRANCQE